MPRRMQATANEESVRSRAGAVADPRAPSLPAALAPLFAVALLLAPHVAAQQPTYDQLRAWCYAATATDSQTIQGCTAVIARQGEPIAEVASAYNNRGAAYAGQRKFDLALQDYDQAIVLQPKYASALKNRGEIYLGRGQYDLALRDFERAIAAEPDFKGAIEARRRTQELKRQAGSSDYDRLASWCFAPASTPEEKLRGCSAVIDRPTVSAQDRSSAYNNRGGAQADLGRYELAIPDYDKALGLNPANANAWYNRCVGHNARKQYEFAERDCSEAIRLKPDFSNAYAVRGDTHLGRRDVERALQDYDRAIELVGDNVFALIKRCRAKAIVDRFDNALADCNHAGKLIADTTRNPLWLGSIGFLTLKREDAARRHVHRYDWLFGVESPEPTYDVALRYFDQALRLRARDPWSLYGRGIARRRQGDIRAGNDDLAAASNQDDSIAATMEHYGLRP